MKRKDIFTLYPDCKLVNGKEKYAICDLTRDRIYMLSRNYGELLEHQQLEVKKSNENIIKFLIENELGEINLSHSFQEISDEYIFPSYITNVIIEISKTSIFDYTFLSNQLTQLGCKFISFRFIDFIFMKDLLNTLHFFLVGSVEDLEINMEYRNIQESDIESENLHLSTPILSRINIYNSPIEQVKRLKTGLLVRSTKKELSCDLTAVNFDYPKFTKVNTLFFNESKKYNNCLNRKMFFGKDGCIKNCPKSPEIYGNINSKDTDLKKIASNADFQKYWFYNKDKIEGCRDCPLRYCCLDCRFANRNTFSLKKPNNCHYM